MGIGAAINPPIKAGSTLNDSICKWWVITFQPTREPATAAVTRNASVNHSGVSIALETVPALVKFMVRVTRPSAIHVVTLGSIQNGVIGAFRSSCHVKNGKKWSRREKVKIKRFLEWAERCKLTVVIVDGFCLTGIWLAHDIAPYCSSAGLFRARLWSHVTTEFSSL